MRVAAARIDGFRLLDDVHINFEDNTTIIVGRNNSGKTSFIEVFYKFLGADRDSFSLDDFTLARIEMLREAYQLWKDANDKRAEGEADQAAKMELQAIDKLPIINLDLEFEYEESESLAPIADLVLDLDPERHDALLRCQYSIGRPRQFFKAFEDSSADDIVTFTRKRMKFFERQFSAVDKEDETNTRELDSSQVKNALSCNFIYAQHLFDDTSLDTGHGLSKGFESYFRAISDTEATVDEVESVLEDVADKLDGEYSSLFSAVFDDLKVFGAGRMSSLQEVKVVSDLSAANLLRGSTKVMYAHESDSHLPEAHNGLGFSKLIYIVLQFVAFFESYKRRQPRSGTELLFVEEPEAHLHPQMQAVFIKNVTEYLRSKPEWKVQLIVTTHSSHVVADSGFSALRYFDASSGSLAAKDLSAFSLDLETGGKDLEKEELNFLKQYMEIQRCDMFFADKIIMVEGTVERLLLPEMISRAAPDLQREYISVIEVGGAHAIKFRKLLEFLGVRTLIITDLDSGEKGGRHKKTPTYAKEAVTTNVTLKKWIPEETSVADLLSKTESDKISGHVRVTYQLPEKNNARVGRSFEEAFILANAERLVAATGLTSNRVFMADDGTQLTADQVRSGSYEIAERIDSKSDFAFDILLLDEWKTPKYIEEGLKWLAPLNK